MDTERHGTVIKALKSSGILWIALILMTVLLLAFEIIPAIYILVTSFNSSNGFTLLNFVRALTEKYYVSGLINSFLISIVSALAGLLIGTCAAVCIKSVNANASDRIITFINMTSNYCGVPLAFAFIVLLGTNGIFTLLLKNAFHLDLYQFGFNLYSWTGISLMYVYFQIPLAVMLMFPAVGGLTDSVKEAAQILGAGNFKFWIHVGIPTLLPSLLGSYCILFANSMGAYASAYALVGSNKNIVAISIANLVSGDINPNPYLASALAVIMGLILMIMVFVKSRLNKRSV